MPLEISTSPEHPPDTPRPHEGRLRHGTLKSLVRVIPDRLYLEDLHAWFWKRWPRSSSCRMCGGGRRFSTNPRTMRSYSFVSDSLNPISLRATKLTCRYGAQRNTGQVQRFARPLIPGPATLSALPSHRPYPRRLAPIACRALPTASGDPIRRTRRHDQDAPLKRPLPESSPGRSRRPRRSLRPESRRTIEAVDCSYAQPPRILHSVRLISVQRRMSGCSRVSATWPARILLAATQRIKTASWHWAAAWRAAATELVPPSCPWRARQRVWQSAPCGDV